MQTKTGGIRRILAGLGVLVVFGVLFVIPLCAAIALCTMPCCDHENGPSGLVTSGAMAACEAECGIRSADATPATVVAIARESGIQKVSPMAVDAVHLAAAPTKPHTFVRDSAPQHRRANAALHVLHSVFRI